jgi:hypothetical protein
MPDLGTPKTVITALKQFRDDLAHVNASILALECIEAGERPPSRTQQGLMKSHRGKAVPREHSDTVKAKQAANPLPDGYAEIHLATFWSPNAESWIRFMRHVIRLPVWMLPVVQRVIRRRAWRKAAYPIEQIRAASNREAARLGLHRLS